MNNVKSLFKSRIYINYLNNIKEHSEIERIIEDQIKESFNIVHDGMFFYKTIFYTYNLTKMECYFSVFNKKNNQLNENNYLFTKEISFYQSLDGFWIKKVTHYIKNDVPS